MNTPSTPIEEELRGALKEEFQSNNYYAESAIRDDVAHPGRLYVTKKGCAADSYQVGEHLDFASEKHIDAIMQLFKDYQLKDRADRDAKVKRDALLGLASSDDFKAVLRSAISWHGSTVSDNHTRKTVLKDMKGYNKIIIESQDDSIKQVTDMIIKRAKQWDERKI